MTKAPENENGDSPTTNELLRGKESTTGTGSRNGMRDSEVNNTTTSMLHPNKLIVLLDMDECLVHARKVCTSSHQPKLDGEVPNLPENAPSYDSFRFARRDDDSYSSVPKYSNFIAYIRPGCIEFLHQVTQLYDTYIYTGSASNYANPILDHLSQAVIQEYRTNTDTTVGTVTGTNIVQQESTDTNQSTLMVSSSSSSSSSSFSATPKNCIFRGRYYHEHGFHDESNYRVKVLSQLHTHKRDFSIPSQTNKMVLVDNYMLFIEYNSSNGILVDSFFGPFQPTSEEYQNVLPHGVEDTTFKDLLQIFHELSLVPDVRPVIEEEQKRGVRRYFTAPPNRRPPPPPKQRRQIRYSSPPSSTLYGNS